MGHGRQIKVVGFADAESLGDIENVRAFLLEVVAAVGMRPLGEPQMHDVALDLSKLNVEPFEDEGGVTGALVLSTSHCTIHTWPLRGGLLVMDLYSCRTFEDENVILTVLKSFKTTLNRLRVYDLSFALVPPTVG